MREARIAGSPFRLAAENRIPFDGGMGSSATAILAGVYAFRRVHGLSLAKDEIMRDALIFETHPDNLGAALYGGFIVGLVQDDGVPRVLKADADPDLKCLLIHPHVQLKTEESRRRLPFTVQFSDAVYSLGRGCFLTLAMTQKRYDLFYEAMKDKLHEPGRMHSRLDYPSLKANFPKEYFYGWALSGSGPSVILFCKEYHPDILSKVESHFENLGLKCDLFRLKGDNEGLLVEERAGEP